MKRTVFGKLSPTYRKLVNAAERAMQNAYAPYSSHWAGAALLTKDGRVITASNVENASWDCVHAERAAVARANAMGVRVFKAMALITKLEHEDTITPSAPCGNCRQTLFESAQLGGSDFPLILANTSKQKIILTSVFELLPLAFGPRELGVDLKRYR